MARGGTERPPLWAWLVAVAAIVMVGVAALVAHARPAPATMTADPGNSLTSAAAGPGPIVQIIGDSYTGGSDQGGNGANGWPRLVGARLAADGYNVQIAVQAAGGAGYVARGPSGQTFDDLVKRGSRSTSLYVFFGSRNDAGKPEVQAAAAATFADAKLASPAARLLVIGPPYVNGNPPPPFRDDDSSVRAAASAAGATFVDPQATGWFSGANSALIGADHVHPTDAGHRYLAGLIAPQIEQALAAAKLGR